jgi:hypothetical protein
VEGCECISILQLATERNGMEWKYRLLGRFLKMESSHEDRISLKQIIGFPNNSQRKTLNKFLTMMKPEASLFRGEDSKLSQQEWNMRMIWAQKVDE